MSQPSAAQLAANRANAQLSTGPKSDEGKAKSSLNAVKSGLTGRTVVLPTDDATAYLDVIAHLTAAHKPASYEETQLVQSLADTEWRLRRIPNIEAGIFALGRRQFADQFPDEPELIDAQTFIAYRRDLSNLSIQESRLRRQYEKDLAKLEALKAQRPEEEPEDEKAQQKPVVAKPTSAQQPQPTAPATQPTIGFEFSTSQSPVKKAAA